MKINKVIALLLGVLFISGCGDQVWCGENGCSGRKIVDKSENTRYLIAHS